ncbi:ATP-binding protein [Azospirillum sp. A1-3]|uniref:sensor histidine kinase n=1 Tax=Azospirillum sp. A1-3 TaxID=185874 RepID=UPI0020773CA7|nr:ATP-binding protein [Azospirillum sp. A1-3]MCM8738829.1 ATP-binding protein [Azospirillum sp. A1-3]
MPYRLVRLARKTRTWPNWKRYLTATSIALTAIGLRWMLLGPEPYPYVLAFPAVITSGLILNRGSAFLTLAICALLGTILFVKPIDALYIPNPVDAVALILYLATAIPIAILIENLHVSVHELSDANEQLAALKEQEQVLLSEAAHRRQNDLQRLIATFQLQAKASNDDRVRLALEEAAGRVQALVRVDRHIEHHRNGPDTVDIGMMLSGLVEDIRQSGAELRPIAFDVAVQAAELPREQAVAVSLIVTEVVNNALKYAFPEERAGTITVRFRRDGEAFVLSMADDGVGFDPASAPRGTGLGRRLVQALAAQLRGHVKVQPGDAKGGTLCTVQFPARV